MKKSLSLIIPLFIVLGINIYFRMFPLYFPQLKIQAKNIVEQRIRAEAAKEINKNFSEFITFSKEKLIEVNVLDFNRNKKREIKNQIKEEYQKLKDRSQGIDGQTYLMELDCWHLARYVENVLHFGHPGDKVINGKQWDSLMLAPSGMQIPWPHFLYYLSAFLYKIFSLFKNVTLFTFLFYLPLFFITIFMVVFYLFCYRFLGYIAGIISCLFVGLSPIFLMRSHAGWFDTDILNLFFPLLIVWSYLLASQAQSLRLRTLRIFISSFWIGLFSFTWTHWWFIFLIVVIYEIYSLCSIFIHFKYEKNAAALFKQHFLSLCLFLLFSCIWIVILSGFEPFTYLYQHIKLAMVLNKSITSSIWPNTYSTVAELRKADILQIANSVGGVFLFAASLLCMLTLFIRIMRNPESGQPQRQFIVILSLWFIIMFFSCFRGARFSTFMLIPLGVCLGWIINEAYEYVKRKNKKPLILSLAVIMIVLCAQFINNAYHEANSIFPLMNDNWHKVLTKVKETTPREAVINSWWDFGDWFKVVSKRRVIFDGQSQDTPQAYWMAKVLLSQNEEEALAILRMLNNGGNKAFEIIDKEIHDPFKSVILLEKAILAKDRQTARQVLLEVSDASAVECIIRILFDKPAKAYFIVEHTMLDKMSAISFLGNWNFARVYLAQNKDSIEKDKIINKLIMFGIDKRQNEMLIQEVKLLSDDKLAENWVSRKISFHDKMVEGHKDKDDIFFDNGLVYNLKEQYLYLYSQRKIKFRIPKSLFILEEDRLKEITYPDSELDFSALIFKGREDYRAILLDRQLGSSIFAYLYFLEGRGLKHFKPFIEERDGDNYIRVFEIIWD